VNFGRRYVNSLLAADLLPPAEPPGVRNRAGHPWWRRYLASLLDIPLGPSGKEAAVRPAVEARRQRVPKVRSAVTGAPVGRLTPGGTPARSAAVRGTSWPAITLAALLVALAVIVVLPSLSGLTDGGKGGVAQSRPPGSPVVTGDPGTGGSGGIGATASAGPPTVSRSASPRTPAGCEEALAAVNSYNQSAGSSQADRAAAADKAASALGVAYQRADDPGVGQAALALADDFAQLANTLASGQTAGDDTARMSTDIQTLNSVCAPR
jgi:hypothetical protein